MTIPSVTAPSVSSSSADVVRVLLNTSPGGFVLSTNVLRELLNRRPELFDEPFPETEFACGGLSAEEAYGGCVVRDGQVFFLKPFDRTVRTDGWLLEQFDALGSEGLAGKYCGTLQAVEVPADVQWHIFEHEDGSEAVHENHRVWS